MKRMFVLLIALSALIITPATLASFEWDDGLTHTIDDPSIYQTTITLDDGVVNTPGTHAEIEETGVASTIYLYNNSTLTVSGGIATIIQAYGNSDVLVESGRLDFTYALGNSEVNIKGGEFIMFSAQENGVIYLHGSDFELNVDGTVTSLSYGDKLSSFAEYDGLLSGTLLDSSSVNDIPIEIYRTEAGHTADIVIVPEPCSLVLLALGGVILRRRPI